MAAFHKSHSLLCNYLKLSQCHLARKEFTEKRPFSEEKICPKLLKIHCSTISSFKPLQPINYINSEYSRLNNYNAKPYKTEIDKIMNPTNSICVCQLQWLEGICVTDASAPIMGERRPECQNHEQIVKDRMLY